MIRSSSSSSIKATTRTTTTWKKTNHQQQDQQPYFNEHNVVSTARNLIIVAGHSVLLSTADIEDANIDETDWYMLSYQTNKGLPQVIHEHIIRGIQETYIDPTAVLLFSGGQTRRSIGPESEGSSYYRVADGQHLWTTAVDELVQQQQQLRSDNNNNNNNGNTVASSTSSSSSYLRSGSSSGSSRSITKKMQHNNNNNDNNNNTVRARTITEEYATDSFQNLLYSICRFYEITGGRYPHNITMISYTFKENRFRNYHIPAIHWPKQQFHYIGIDPDPTTTGFDLKEATKGEYDNALQIFQSDPYGCSSSTLKEKRIERNPFYRTPPYDQTCPDMHDLFQYCETTIIDASKVPWTRSFHGRGK